ncbi:hypothetical protein GC207_05420 [bacterium]|nr:hypothetical protein [bacterium]
MLTRISLIVVILAGIGAIVFGQMQVKQKIDKTIADRNQFHQDWQKELARANKLEKDLAQAQADLKQKEVELAAAQKQIQAKDAEIASLNAEVQRRGEELRIARADRDKAQAELQRYQATGMQPDEIKGLIASYTKSLAQIKTLEASITDKDREINGLKVRIAELVGDEAPVILPAGLKGKVVTVDPKWDFVVINLGKEDGLLLNGQMLVSRNGKLLAKVKIVNVMENRAIANVMTGWKLNDIMEGDTVLY